jgi:hypothetical protein
MRAKLTLVGVLLFATPATAQDIPPALDMTLMVGWAGQGAALEQMKQEMGLSKSRPRAAKPRPVRPAQFAFRPDPVARQRVHARVIAQVRRSDPADATKLATALGSGQFTRDLSRYLAGYNMSANDLADTTALYLAMAWLATRASSADPTRAQMQGLRRQVAATLASMPTMARASNAAKQEWAESNLIQASFASVTANEAARNPGYAAKARPIVARGVMSSYRIDLLRLDLTDRGLRSAT